MDSDRKYERIRRAFKHICQDPRARPFCNIFSDPDVCDDELIQLVLQLRSDSSLDRSDQNDSCLAANENLSGWLAMSTFRFTACAIQARDPVTGKPLSMSLWAQQDLDGMPCSGVVQSAGTWWPESGGCVEEESATVPWSDEDDEIESEVEEHAPQSANTKPVTEILYNATGVEALFSLLLAKYLRAENVKEVIPGELKSHFTDFSKKTLGFKSCRDVMSILHDVSGTHCTSALVVMRHNPELQRNEVRAFGMFPPEDEMHTSPPEHEIDLEGSEPLVHSNDEPLPSTSSQPGRQRRHFGFRALPIPADMLYPVEPASAPTSNSSQSSSTEIPNDPTKHEPAMILQCQKELTRLRKEAIDKKLTSLSLRLQLTDLNGTTPELKRVTMEMEMALRAKTLIIEELRLENERNPTSENADKILTLTQQMSSAKKCVALCRDAFLNKRDSKVDLEKMSKIALMEATEAENDVRAATEKFAELRKDFHMVTLDTLVRLSRKRPPYQNHNPDRGGNRKDTAKARKCKEKRKHHGGEGSGQEDTNGKSGSNPNCNDDQITSNVLNEADPDSHLPLKKRRKTLTEIPSEQKQARHLSDHAYSATHVVSHQSTRFIDLTRPDEAFVDLTGGDVLTESVGESVRESAGPERIDDDQIPGHTFLPRSCTYPVFPDRTPLQTFQANEYYNPNFSGDFREALATPGPRPGRSLTTYLPQTSHTPNPYLPRPRFVPNRVYAPQSPVQQPITYYPRWNPYPVSFRPRVLPANIRIPIPRYPCQTYGYPPISGLSETQAHQTTSEFSQIDPHEPTSECSQIDPHEPTSECSQIDPHESTSES
ncbi:C3 [callitrichine gammaherpesvirus 3]|uniref:C3 n=1 Tax=callitrichine gammaherpesvirus 3 TaxID=106331 RepID=Q993G5_9GAMA|nr:C3 [callitrichine gammaherpesvirus 3]AAK38253.2 C3 [callitrichine gammaherpesvirus 3]